MHTPVMWEITSNLLTCAFAVGLIVLALAVFASFLCMVFKAAEREVHDDIMRETVNLLTTISKGENDGHDKGDS